jgi:hypothetical protein
MLIAFLSSWILNKLFGIDNQKTFMVYFVLLSWLCLTKLEQLLYSNTALTVLLEKANGKFKTQKGDINE